MTGQNDRWYIPAVCPTCGLTFPSHIAIGPHVKGIIVAGNYETCPNGHLAPVLSGTFDVYEGLVVIHQGIAGSQIIDRIQEVAQAGLDNPETASEALASVAELLPPEAAAAIKKLSPHNPLYALLVIISLITSLVTAGTDAVKAFHSDAPAPAPIIQNTNTIINNVAPPQPSKPSVEGPPKREQIRRLKQMDRQKQKSHGKGHKGHTSTDACEPKSS